MAFRPLSKSVFLAGRFSCFQCLCVGPRAGAGPVGQGELLVSALECVGLQDF